MMSWRRGAVCAARRSRYYAEHHATCRRSSQAMREGSGAGVDEGRRHPCSLRISISGQCWPYPSTAVSLWPEEVEDLDGKFWLPFPPPPVLVLVTAESFDWRAVRALPSGRLVFCKA